MDLLLISLAREPILKIDVVTFQLYRLVQNRISAQRFRQKRKNEFENLKENFNTVLKDNEKLRNQVSLRSNYDISKTYFINDHLL